MKQLYKYSVIILAALMSLTSCSEDEPAKGPKTVEERTVLAIDGKGNIYNLSGELIKTLPDCEEVTQIITEGEDYFVSGVNSKMKVGYWKNGKWSTLHVDFIDDVEHWTFGIAKWDYNIYLLDYPNVLRNSGIFRLEDCEHFNPARHGISVSEGHCFVVGADHVEIVDYSFEDKPVLYYLKNSSLKKKVLPLPEGVTTGTATGIYAFDGNHYIACGFMGDLFMQGVVWDDKDNIQVLNSFSPSSIITMANAIEKLGDHTYVAGIESSDGVRMCSMLWTDNEPQRLIYATDFDSVAMSIVTDMQGYGNDIYVLTQETLYDSETYSVIWLNGHPIAKIDKSLISLAIY